MSDPAFREAQERARIGVGVHRLAELIERHAPSVGLTFEEATDGRIDWPAVAPFGERGEVSEAAVIRALEGLAGPCTDPTDATETLRGGRQGVRRDPSTPLYPTPPRS